jgi:hypothetical protein
MHRQLRGWAVAEAGRGGRWEKGFPPFLVFSFEFKYKHKFTDYVNAQLE